MSLILKETTDFVRACEALHARMEHEPLTPDERDLIEIGCLDLLSKLKSTPAGNFPIEWQ